MVAQGTVSALVGSHSVVHSCLVLLSWHILYGEWPKPWQVVCIFIHDIGHIGKNYLDDIEEKHSHWILGARIAGKLFGAKGYALVAGHDGYNEHEQSLLYKPDKYSWNLAPYWWLYWNNIVEPKIRCGMKSHDAIVEFKVWVKKNVESGEYRPTHDAQTERQHRMDA